MTLNPQKERELIALTRYKQFMQDTRGDAFVVEAVFLFPIASLLTLFLVLLSSYLPQRLILQDAAQFVATALASEASDTSVSFDTQGNFMQRSGNDLSNVYVATFNDVFGRSLSGMEARAVSIAESLLSGSVLVSDGELVATCTSKNYVIYQEITVTLTREITYPIDFSLIGVPETFTITQSAKAVVQNGDEFVRNIAIATDITKWVDKKFGISEAVASNEVFSDVFRLVNKVLDLLNIERG